MDGNDNDEGLERRPGESGKAFKKRKRANKLAARNPKKPASPDVIDLLDDDAPQPKAAPALKPAPPKADDVDIVDLLDDDEDDSPPPNAAPALKSAAPKDDDIVDLLDAWDPRPRKSALARMMEVYDEDLAAAPKETTALSHRSGRSFGATFDPNVDAAAATSAAKPAALKPASAAPRKAADDDVILVDARKYDEPVDATIAELDKLSPYDANLLRSMRDNKRNNRIVCGPIRYQALCPTPEHRGHQSLANGGENIGGDFQCASVQNFHHLMNVTPEDMNGGIPDHLFGDAGGVVRNCRLKCPVKKPEDGEKCPGCPGCTKTEAKEVAKIHNLFITGCEQLDVITAIVNIGGTSVGIDKIFKLLKKSRNVVLVPEGPHISHLSSYHPGAGLTYEGWCERITGLVSLYSNGIDEVRRRAGLPPLQRSVVDSLCDLEDLFFVTRRENIPTAVALFRASLSDAAKERMDSEGFTERADGTMQSS